MANYKVIHDRISKGRGKAAKRVGQPFVARRLGERGVVELIPQLFCMLRRVKGGSVVEQRIFVSQVFELLMDVRRLQVGDWIEELPEAKHAQQRFSRVVTDQDPQLSIIGDVAQAWAPIYMLIHARPVHKFIGIKLDQLCQVRRGTTLDIPDPPGGDAGYQQQGQAAEQAFCLRPGHGTFELFDVRAMIAGGGDNDTITPAVVPFQLEPSIVKGTTGFDLPLDWQPNKWFFACPGNWAGFRLRENDHVIAPDGNRFRIISLFENHIGAIVMQGLVEKLES